MCGDASLKVMHVGSLIYHRRLRDHHFLGVAGNTATPLDSTQAQKQRNMRRGAWVKSPDYYYFAGVFRFLPTNQSANCVALRTAVQICQLHIAAGVDFIDKSVIGHYIGENVSSNQQPLIISLLVCVSGRSRWTDMTPARGSMFPEVSRIKNSTGHITSSSLLEQPARGERE